MSWAALLLAAALLSGAGPARVRIRAGRSAPVHRSTPSARSRDDPLAVASSLDVFAVCLGAGMAVSAAAAATAPTAPPPLAAILQRAADLLTLGADGDTAWSSPAGSSGGRSGEGRYEEALLRLARRSAESGTALAHGVAELAAQSRLDAVDAAGAAAERAGVLIAGPLGLCYLPAFVCLGIVPIVAGLAGDVLRSGVL